MQQLFPAVLAAFGLIAVVSLVRWVVIPALKRAFLNYLHCSELPLSFWFTVTGLIILSSSGMAIGSGDVRWIAGGLLVGTAVSVVASRLRH